MKRIVESKLNQMITEVVKPKVNFRKQVVAALGENTSDKIVAHKDGTVSVKRTYFYRHGMDSQKWADKVIAKCGEFANVIDHADHWRAWPKESYFVVTLAPKQ